MISATFPPGYMKNRICSSSFLLAPNGWMTLSRPQKRIPVSVMIRNIAQSKLRMQMFCSVHSINKILINTAKPGIGRKLHTSANYRSNTNTCNLTLDFWDAALLSLAAVGLSIGFIKSYPYDRRHLLSLEASDEAGDNDGCAVLHNFGGEGGGGMKADIEMTLHQPPSFNGHVKSISTMPTDSQAATLKRNVSRSKPYDVSHLIHQV